MSTEKAPKLSTWLLWAPLKFSVISFLGLTVTTFIYTLFTNLVLKTPVMPRTPLTILLILVIVACTYQTLCKIPKFKMDQRSFIGITNAQTTIAAVAFSISAYFIFKYAQQILLHLVILESKTSIGLLLIGLTATIFCLYLIGLLLCGVYAKYLRARELGIPAWKVICSMPLGFAAMWIPGYVFKEDNSKKSSIQINSKWYNRLLDWIVASKTNAIASFVIITLATIFFLGLNSALLTFILALIFGIWSLQIGTQKFLKNMGKTYSNIIVTINIILVALLIVFSTMAPPVTKKVQLNISDIETTQIQL